MLEEGKLWRKRQVVSILAAFTSYQPPSLTYTSPSPKKRKTNESQNPNLIKKAQGSVRALTLALPQYPASGHPSRYSEKGRNLAVKQHKCSFVKMYLYGRRRLSFKNIQRFNLYRSRVTLASSSLQAWTSLFLLRAKQSPRVASETGSEIPTPIVRDRRIKHGRRRKRPPTRESCLRPVHRRYRIGIEHKTNCDAAQ